MSDIALQKTAAGKWHRFVHGWRRFLLGIADGIEAACRYERLAALSDTELARLRLTREELPWLAFSGHRPLPPGASARSPGD